MSSYILKWHRAFGHNFQIWLYRWSSSTLYHTFRILVSFITKVQTGLWLPVPRRTLWQSCSYAAFVVFQVSSLIAVEPHSWIGWFEPIKYHNVTENQCEVFLLLHYIWGVRWLMPHSLMPISSLSHSSLLLNKQLLPSWHSK